MTARMCHFVMVNMKRYQGGPFYVFFILWRRGERGNPHTRPLALEPSRRMRRVPCLWPNDIHRTMRQRKFLPCDTTVPWLETAHDDRSLDTGPGFCIAYILICTV